MAEVLVGLVLEIGIAVVVVYLAGHIADFEDIVDTALGQAAERILAGKASVLVQDTVVGKPEVVGKGYFCYHAEEK